jgi:semaphorin 5
MSAIEKAFEGPVKFQIAPGSPVWQQKVIDNREQFECRSSHRSNSNLVDASKYQLMARSVLSNTQEPLYIEKLEKFVRIAVTKVATKLHENVKIIFAANSEGFIKKVSILPRTKQSCLIEVLEPEYVGIKIETMRFIKSTESLYVGTQESIMKIPSQHCSRHLSKVSCINSMDP